MLVLYKWQTKLPSPSPVSMIMQVHDELVFEVDKTAVASVLQPIQTMMESVVTLAVPLIVSMGVGDSWDEANSN